MSFATTNRSSLAIIYGIPLLIAGISIGLSFSPLLAAHPELAAGITYDLTISAPVVYLILIWKTDIPKITVLPILSFGVIAASLILPGEMQFHLELVKFWLLPLAEVALFGYIGFAVYRAVVLYRAEKLKSPDVLTIFREVCQKVFDKHFSKTFLFNRLLLEKNKKPLSFAWFTNALALELGVFYYGFISWRSFERSADNFSYHKTSGVRVLYSAVLFIVTSETVVLHIVLERWSSMLAWVVTAPSLYLTLQIFAHMKAMSQRPIEFADGKIIVRSGLFGETTIDIADIESVELSSVVQDGNQSIKRAGLLRELEQFNTVINLRSETIFYGFYGLKSRYRTLLVYVDQNARFKERIDNYESD